VLNLEIRGLSPREVEAVQYLHSTCFPLWFWVLGGCREWCVQDQCTWSVVSENAARNQLAPACAQRWSQRVNQAAPSLSHDSPVRAPVPVRTHCTNAWWNRCKTDLNSFPHGRLDRTAGASSYYMDENHSAGFEVRWPWCGQLTWLRTVHSGDWCLCLALCTLSGVCQKWWY